MKVICIRDISPIIKKDDVLLLSGKYFVKEGYDNKKLIRNNHNGRWVETPNFYAKELVLAMTDYFKIIK